MSISSVKIRHARLIVVAMTLVAAVAILLLTHSYTFYFDEWTFILTAPDWTWITYLQPHNEHPVMLPRLIYAALLSTVGLRSYLPYMAVLLALHATSAVLLFEIVRRRAGDLVAIGCAALFLVLGAAWENLLWAFQITFVGSVACGLGMLLALEGPSTPRRLLAAALLLAGSAGLLGDGDCVRRRGGGDAGRNPRSPAGPPLVCAGDRALRGLVPGPGTRRNASQPAAEGLERPAGAALRRMGPRTERSRPGR